MKDRNTALLWGALIGTLILGPIVGAAIGASAGGVLHEAANGPDGESSSNDNDDQEPDYNSAM